MANSVIEKKIEFDVGSQDIEVAAGQLLNTAISFNRVFTSTPKVFVSLHGWLNPGSEVEFPVIISTSTTGFVVRLKSLYSQTLSIPIYWFAVS